MIELIVFALMSLAISSCVSIDRNPAGQIITAESPVKVWPNDDWQTSRDSDPEAYKKFETNPDCSDFFSLAIDQKDSDDGMKTDTIAVVRSGKIVYEYYDEYYKPDTPHCLWSSSKSVSALLLGAAVQKGHIRWDEKLEDLFPRAQKFAGLANERLYSQIEVRDLIQMSTTFEWREGYDVSVADSSVLPMLYTRGHQNPTEYALQMPMIPEKKWVYNSGNSNILMAALKKKYRGNYDQMPWELLFQPIGAKSAVFEQDPSGVFLGAAFVHLSTRDMARIGQLMLHNGTWNGLQILPQWWMDSARQIAPAQLLDSSTPEYLRSWGTYGGGLWLNEPIQSKNVPKSLPDISSEVYFTAGHYGQTIFVFPKDDLIIVRTGHDETYWHFMNKFLKYGLKCFAPDVRNQMKSRL